MGDDVVGEVVDRAVQLLEEVTGPNNLSGVLRHVSNHGGSSLVLIEAFDNAFDL